MHLVSINSQCFNTNSKYQNAWYKCAHTEKQKLFRFEKTFTASSFRAKHFFVCPRFVDVMTAKKGKKISELQLAPFSALTHSAYYSRKNYY